MLKASILIGSLKIFNQPECLKPAERKLKVEILFIGFRTKFIFYLMFLRQKLRHHL